MLRRREIHQGTSIPERPVLQSSALSSSAGHGTPLPFLRNHSVATSKPSSYENAHVVQSYFRRASRASSSSIAAFSASAKSTPSWIYYFPAILLLILPWLSPHTLHEEIQQSRMRIRTLKKKQKDLVQQIDGIAADIQNYYTKIHASEQENKLEFDELRQNGDMISHLNFNSEQYLEVERSEEGLFVRLDTLERHIQKTNAKMVMQNYGPSPHRVKVNVLDMRSKVLSFVLELAPTTEMPHAVHHFLQMVERNLWDGLSMMLNGGMSDENPNRWTISPMRMDLRFGQHSWEGQRFEAANLTHMVFTEHSSNYPPQGKFQYSVAFSGHPGGPSFYIRMDDDSAEEHITDVHQQASTFATVVEGFDVLTRYTINEAPNKRTAAKKKERKMKKQSMQLLTIQSMELLPNDRST